MTSANKTIRKKEKSSRNIGTFAWEDRGEAAGSWRGLMRKWYLNLAKKEYVDNNVRDNLSKKGTDA